MQRTFRDGRPPFAGFVVSDKPVAEDISSVAPLSRILFVFSHEYQLPNTRGAPRLDTESQRRLGKGEGKFKR